jgi:hypothetical protein
MEQPLRRSGILLAPLVFVCVAGCSGLSSQGTVNGTVTLDGQPLTEGVVRFVPVDGKSQTATENIKDGKFSATVPLGEMRVEFSAPKVGKPHKVYDTPDSPVVEDVGELIPARFNVRSEFKITVKKGSQDETFALQSK